MELLTIKQIRVGLNMTQKEMAKYLNVIKLRNDEPSRYYCLDGVFI